MIVPRYFRTVVHSDYLHRLAFPAVHGYRYLISLFLYVTGSNSKLLSSDIMTEFRGRGDVVQLFPLSFSEFYSLRQGNKDDALKEYMIYGGLPLVVQKETVEQKQAYLKNLFVETYFKDIVERNKIEKEDILSALTDVLCSATGSLTNIKRLTDTINSVKRNKPANKVSYMTVKSYVSFLKDAFIMSEARRYDIRGKQYFDTQSKFYCTDVGLRNARLNFRQIEYSHLMENVIYNHLIQKGFSVDVGMVPMSHTGKNGKSFRAQYEIDFVVNKGMFQYYIQSSFNMDDGSKEASELYPFSIVHNSFKKIVITRTGLMPYYDDNGIVHVGLADFLLDDNILKF